MNSTPRMTDNGPRRSAAASWLALAAAAAVLLATAFVAAPATVFLFNTSQVTIPFTAVLRTAWPLAIGLATVIGLLAAVVGHRGRRLLGVLMLALALLLHVQGNVLVWDYGMFDGQDVDWSHNSWHGVVESVVWLGGLAAAIRWHRRLWRQLPTLAIALALLSSGSLAAHVLGGRSFTPADATGVDDRIYDFSRDRNVLLIVMDAFAAPSFAHLLAEEPALRTRLEGFTWYRDALGVYPTTLPSLPAILSGRTTDNSRPIREFLRESLAHSLPVVFAGHGFATHTVTEPIYGEYLDGVPFAGHVAFLDAQPADRRRRDAYQIWNVALFRYLPHVLKRRIYADHRWLLQPDTADGATTTEAPVGPYVLEEPYRVPSPGQQVSWVIRRQMLDRATGESARPTFKMLHFFTTHSPFFLDADCEQLTVAAYEEMALKDAVLAQSACALDQVLELLDHLDGLGVLDRTLVLLAGDHGSNVEMLVQPDDGKAWNRIPGPTKVLPLLLVKPVGAKGSLQVSNAPVSLTDIAGTAVSAMGIEEGNLGPGLAEAGADSNRTRLYFDYTWQHAYWWEEYLPPLTAYRVTGPARDPDSWGPGRPLPAGTAAGEAGAGAGAGAGE